MENPPDKPAGDLVAAVARGLVGMVPGAGGLLVELGNQLNPLEKRKQIWAQRVADAITEIESKLSILPSALWRNEAFVSFAWEATFIALKNHRTEKLRALQAALVSMATCPQPDEDMAFQHLRYVDELTVTHLKLLACFAQNAEKYVGINAVSAIMKKTESFLGEQINRGSFRSFLADLERAFMIRCIDFEEMKEDGPSPDYLVGESSAPGGLVVTPRGNAFLAFIRAA
ncbi:MAG: hypothetical protein ACREXY_14495 [Gammaproteobacteria bacterium]